MFSGLFCIYLSQRLYNVQSLRKEDTSSHVCSVTVLGNPRFLLACLIRVLKSTKFMFTCVRCDNVCILFRSQKQGSLSKTLRLASIRWPSVTILVRDTYMYNCTQGYMYVHVMRTSSAIHVPVRVNYGYM